MKRRLTLVLAGLALIVLMGACRVVVNPFVDGSTVGADATAEATLVSDLSDAAIQWYEESTGYPTNGTPLTPALASGTLPALAGQVIRVTFTNGIIDAGTIAAAVAVYPLTVTAAADGAYTRGAALAVTASVVPDGTGGSRLELAADLSAATVSDQLELVILGSALTANNGSNRMDLDGDGVYGEAGEDDLVDYVTVTGAPVTAVGNARAPQGLVAITAYGNVVVGQTTIVLTVQNGAGGVSGMTAASLSAGLTVAMFAAATGTWATVTPTYTYDDAGSLTATFPTAFVAGDLLRWTVNTYLVTESATVRGYTHRAGYNGADPGVRDSIRYRGAVHATFLANVTAARPEARGTAKVTTFADYSAANKDFAVSSNGGSPTTVTLVANTTSLATLVTAVNDAFTTAGVDANYQASQIDIDYDSVNDAVRIARISGSTGIAQYITLAAGAADALAGLGMAAGSYTGKSALTGSPFAGFTQSAQSTSDHARWVELNFSGGVSVATVSASSIQIIDTADDLPVAWTTVGAVSATAVRISLPATFLGDGTYLLRIHPTVTDTAGVPYADTSIAGTRDGTPIGDQADFPYWESGTWDWD